MTPAAAVALRVVRANLRAIASYDADDNMRNAARDALDALDMAERYEALEATAPQARKAPFSNAEKCRRKRLLKKGIDPDGDPSATPSDPAATPDRPQRDPASGSRRVSRDLNLDLHLPQRSQDFRGSRSLDTREGGDPSATPSDPAATPAGSHGESAPVPPLRPATNATDDGCFGMGVNAWREGVREATGRPITLSLGVTRHLVDVLVDHCPDVAQREAWARAKAAAWAKGCKAAGIMLNPHKFSDWLANEERFSSPRLQTSAPGETAEQRAARASAEDERQRERDAEWKRLEREAAPMPADLLAAVGGALPGVRRAR